MSLGSIRREHDRIADNAHEWLASDRKASVAMSRGAMQNAQEAMMAAQSGRIPTPSMPEGMSAISLLEKLGPRARQRPDLVRGPSPIRVFDQPLQSLDLTQHVDWRDPRRLPRPSLFGDGR